MGDTYNSAAEAEADRAQQQMLLKAWDRALRRDECGAWRIDGSRGSIHTWGDGQTWALYVACRSARHWMATKARLSFCTIASDGDDEGVLMMHQLPTPNQAAVIREVLGIRKRQEISASTLERLRAFAFGRSTRREATLGAEIGGDGPQGI